MGPTPEAIRQLLEDIPSDSDISGADDDSGDNETYMPRDEEAGGEDEDDQDDPDDLGGVGDVAGAGEVDELPYLPEVIPPEDSVGAAGAAVPQPKKLGGQELRGWQGSGYMRTYLPSRCLRAL